MVYQDKIFIDDQPSIQDGRPSLIKNESKTQKIMIWSHHRKNENLQKMKARKKNSSKQAGVNLQLDTQRSDSSHRKSLHDAGQRRILNCMFYSLYDANSPHKS